jgi:hypothetical protein
LGPPARPASYAVCTIAFLGVKRPGLGVDHPPTSSSEVKERGETRIYWVNILLLRFYNLILILLCRETYFVIQKDENRLSTFKKEFLRKISETRKEEASEV